MQFTAPALRTGNSITDGCTATFDTDTQPHFHHECKDPMGHSGEHRCVCGYHWPSTARPDLREAVDSEEFYNLMQAYRHAPISDQERTIATFEAVKDFLKATKGKP